MSKAVEPVLRATEAPGEGKLPSTHPAPAAHVIAMSELEAPRAGPAAGEPANGPLRAASPAAALGDLQVVLRHVKARLTVCVGSAEITVGELLDAQERHVLRLDRTVDQPVDVLLEGQVVARGTLIAVDDQFAVRITELPGRPVAPVTPGRG